MGCHLEHISLGKGIPSDRPRTFALRRTCQARPSPAPSVAPVWSPAPGRSPAPAWSPALGRSPAPGRYSSTPVSAHEVGRQQCVSHQHAAVGGQRHAACRRTLTSRAQPVAVDVLHGVITQRVGGERHQLAAVRLVPDAMPVIGGQPPHRLAAVGAVAGAQLSGRLAGLAPAQLRARSACPGAACPGARSAERARS